MSFELGKQRARESSAMGDKRLITIQVRNKLVRCVIVAASLVSGCGTIAPHDPAAPASHHAQRKYDEAVRKGTVVPMEKGKEDRK
jgi:hypothetical protein